VNHSIIGYRKCLGILQICFFACLNAYGRTDPGLTFIENKNQWPAAVNFAVKIPGGDMFLQPGRFDYYFVDGQEIKEIHQRAHGEQNEANGKAAFDTNIQAHYLRVNFLGANPESMPMPVGVRSPYYNYFIGKDQNRWASKAKSYTGVYYADFYTGIDMKVYSSGSNLKYDYIVKPSADPSHIVVQYEGADAIFLKDGDLEIKTSLAELIERKPYAFQFKEGRRQEVKCEYVLDHNRLSFSFPDGYDACYELVIDPLLIFSTYSGSTADNWGSTATPGEHGNLYSSGVTNQMTLGGKFPSTTGAFQTKYGGIYDIGILKYDSSGEHLLYATYLGGSDSESPHSLVMNSNEELIVLGTTSSLDFPTTSNAIDRIFNGGQFVQHVVDYTNGSDIFVARISKDGATLLGSTYLGGSKNDGLNVRDEGLVRNYGDELRGDIITDASGNIYFSSVTSSSNFPVTKGSDTTFNGGSTDAILVKLNSDLSQIVWGTYLGGAHTDASHTLKLDHNGNIFLAGGTNSIDFPVTSGSYRHVLTGAEDGWIACVKSTGDSILHATFTGTTGYDQVYFLDLNDREEIYVYGQTDGNFPVSPGVYSNPGSGQFIQKFDYTLSTSLFSTVFGSGRHIPDISPTAFLVNKCNNLFMSGWGGVVNREEGFWNNDTRGMPLSSDAFQKTTSGSDFYFIVLADDASEFLYSTYLGGSQSRTHVDGGTCRFDKEGIVYHAVCSGCAAFNQTGHSTSDFPTTTGAWSRTNRSQNCNNAAFKLDLVMLKAGFKSNLATLGASSIKICHTDKIIFQNRSIGGESFEWDFGDGTHLTKTDTSSVTHLYQEPGKYIMKLKAIDLGTCTRADSVLVTIDVFEIQSMAQDNDALCLGTTYQLKAAGGVSYRWQSQDGSFTSSASDPLVEPQDTTVYYVAITESSGCVHQDTVQLAVIPGMILDFELKRITDCFSRPTIDVINHSKVQSTEHVFFDFGDGKTSDADEAEHSYDSDSIYHVKLVGTREFCVSEKTIDVPIFLIKVPNVITPGLAGNNDEFIIQYGAQPGSTPADYGVKVQLIVYNRWGNQVYASKDYQNDWSGEGLASGIYYYEVTIEGQDTCKDWLQIMK